MPAAVTRSSRRPHVRPIKLAFRFLPFAECAVDLCYALFDRDVRRIEPIRAPLCPPLRLGRRESVPSPAGRTVERSGIEKRRPVPEIERSMVVVDGEP